MQEPISEDNEDRKKSHRRHLIQGGKSTVSTFSVPVHWKAKKMKLQGVIKSSLSNVVKKLKKVGK